MNTRKRVITVLDLYSETTGIPPSTVSLKALEHCSKLEQMRQGKRLSTDRAEFALLWSFINWPKTTPSPAILTEWLEIVNPEVLPGSAASSTVLLPRAR